MPDSWRKEWERRYALVSKAFLRKRKFPKLVPHHVLSNGYRNIVPAIVHHESYSGQEKCQLTGFQGQMRVEQPSTDGGLSTLDTMMHSRYVQHLITTEGSNGCSQALCVDHLHTIQTNRTTILSPQNAYKTIRTQQNWEESYTPAPASGSVLDCSVPHEGWERTRSMVL